QQLGHDVVCRHIVDLDAEEDDPLLEQLRVRVVDPVARAGPLAELGNDVTALRGHRPSKAVRAIDGDVEEIRWHVRIHGNVLALQETAVVSVGTWRALRTTWSTKP